MAHAHSIRNVDLGIVDRIAGMIASFKESNQRRKIFRQTVRELSALSNRELADLGMHHSMITRVAHEAAYGK